MGKDSELEKLIEFKIQNEVARRKKESMEEISAKVGNLNKANENRMREQLAIQLIRNDINSYTPPLLGALYASVYTDRNNTIHYPNKLENKATEEKYFVCEEQKESRLGDILMGGIIVLTLIILCAIALAFLIE